MAENVTGASLDGIYDRLNDAPTYHPLEAETFSDWSVEAGDIVTVKRGQESYASPVHSTKLVWKGAPQMTISSTGNKERDPISRVSKKKYARGGGGIRNDQRLFQEFYSEDGYLHSYVLMTESVLITHFDNSLSDVHSNIMQTAEEIRTDVYAANSQLYSYVDQTATYINSVVENAESSLGSAILQTASQIRSEVHAANSAVYTYVDQTATYIWDHVGERGAKVTQSMTAPTGDNKEGDLWLEGNLIRLWNDADLAWNSNTNYDWTQLKGTKLKVYKNGAWKTVTDETTVAEQTDLIRTKDAITLVANNLKYEADGWKRNAAALEVKADEISSRVAEAVNQLGSSITQTATQIRSEVHAANSQIYSAISQTATNISATVASVEEGLQSSINVEKNRISLVVEGTGSNAKIKPASIVTAINNGSSSVVISANHINLDGYVKASDITSDYIKGKISNITNLSTQTITATGEVYVKNSNNQSTSLRNAIYDLDIRESSGTYTLYASFFNQSGWQTIGSFERGGGGGEITDFSIYDASDNDVGGTEITVDSEFELYAQYKEDGVWVYSEPVTLIPSGGSIITNFGIYDDDDNNVENTEITVSSEMQLYAQYKEDGVWVYSGPVTLKPSGGGGGGHTHPVYLSCTAKTAIPGTSQYNYTFTVGGGSSTLGTVGETTILYW